MENEIDDDQFEDEFIPSRSNNDMSITAANDLFVSSELFNFGSVSYFNR
jgi:hypothetical protein